MIQLNADYFPSPKIYGDEVASNPDASNYIKRALAQQNKTNQYNRRFSKLDLMSFHIISFLMKCYDLG